MKTIVTHLSPDCDAVTSMWLILRFLPGWDKAELRFVPAGKTLDNNIVDCDPDILHVDTGMGMLDHHQTDEFTCAAKRTLEYIKKSQKSKVLPRRQADKSQKFEDDALERLVDVINDIDHFREVYYPNPSADLYDFGMVGILDGWKLLYSEDSNKIAVLSFPILDGVYKKFQDKVWAEKEIAEKGVEFQSFMGKGLGIETINDETVRLAQKMGYIIAVRKDPKKGYVRIKSLPDSEGDLSLCYNKLKKLDPDATWFLHAGRKMLLNGSMKNPQSRPTKLTLREIIEVLKK